jgi:hypothetical protein
VTIYNNPAFLMFLMSTLGRIWLEWPVGEDRMLIASVGTGTTLNAKDSLTERQMWPGTT